MPQARCRPSPAEHLCVACESVCHSERVEVDARRRPWGRDDRASPSSCRAGGHMHSTTCCRGIRMLVPRVPAHSCPSSSFLIVTPHSGSTEAHLRVQRKRLTVGLSVRHVHVACRPTRELSLTASPPRVFLHFGRAVPVARVRRVWQVQVCRRRAVGPAPACLWAVNGPCCVYTVYIAVRFDGCSLQRGPGRAAGA